MDPPPTTKSLPSLLAGYFSSTFKSRPWTTNDDDDDDHHHHSPPQLQLEYTQSKIQPEKEIEYRFVVMGGSGVGKSALIHRWLTAAAASSSKSSSSRPAPDVDPSPTVGTHLSSLLLQNQRIYLYELSKDSCCRWPGALDTIDGVFCVFNAHDISSIESLDEQRDLLSSLRHQQAHDERVLLHLYLIAHKSDVVVRTQRRVVSSDDIDSYCTAAGFLDWRWTMGKTFDDQGETSSDRRHLHILHQMCQAVDDERKSRVNQNSREARPFFQWNDDGDKLLHHKRSSVSVITSDRRRGGARRTTNPRATTPTTSTLIPVTDLVTGWEIFHGSICRIEAQKILSSNTHGRPGTFLLRRKDPRTFVISIMQQPHELFQHILMEYTAPSRYRLVPSLVTFPTLLECMLSCQHLAKYGLVRTSRSVGLSLGVQQHPPSVPTNNNNNNNNNGPPPVTNMHDFYHPSGPLMTRLETFPTFFTLAVEEYQLMLQRTTTTTTMQEEAQRQIEFAQSVTYWTNLLACLPQVVH